MNIYRQQETTRKIITSRSKKNQRVRGVEVQEKESESAELMFVNTKPLAAYDPIAKKLVKIEELQSEDVLLMNGEASTQEEGAQGGGMDMLGDGYLVHTEGGGQEYMPKSK
jgi:hypothetical protein